jgi:hypothetical protein
MTSFRSYSKPDVVQGETTLSAATKTNGRFADILSWFPAVSGGAQYQTMLLNALKTGFNFTHVFRSNVAINHDAGNGTAGQVLQSDGDGTTSWATVGTLTDGDKGDITVSSSGTVFTVDNSAITATKIASNAVTNVKVNDVAASKITGQSSDSHIQIDVSNNKIHLDSLRVYVAASNYSALNNTTTETPIIGLLGLAASSQTKTDPDLSSAYTIAANTLAVADQIKSNFKGTFAKTGSPTVRIRIRFGPNNNLTDQIIADTGAITMSSTGASGVIEVDSDLVIKTIGGSGTADGVITSRVILASGESFSLAASGINVSTVNTTVANYLQITFQWGTASASNSIVGITGTVLRVV